MIRALQLIVLIVSAIVAVRVVTMSLMALRRGEELPEDPPILTPAAPDPADIP